MSRSDPGLEMCNVTLYISLMTKTQKPATEIQIGDTIDFGWTVHTVASVRFFKTVVRVMDAETRTVSIRLTETVTVIR